MTRKSFLLASIVSLACAAGAAQAQKVGTYSGTADDGTFLSFSVTKDGSVFSFANGNVNFEAACTNPDRTASESWGFFLGQQIVAGENPFHSGNDYYDTSGSMHFVGSNTLKGSITSVTAVFTPADPPKKAQFCRSAKQAFTLHLQAVPKTFAVHPYRDAVAHKIQ